MEISNLQFQAAIDSSCDHHLEEVLDLECFPKARVQNHEQHQQAEKKLKPNPEQALNCPRCDSTNTKFCYYNNYSLSQPRYFCKGCRRYWTHGGTLRNIPVGGGCRKTRKNSSSPTSKRSHDHQSYQKIPANTHTSLNHVPTNNPSPNPNSGSGFLDMLRSGFLESATNCSNLNMWYGFDDQGELNSGLAAANSPSSMNVMREAVNSNYGSAIEVDGESKNMIVGADLRCDGVRIMGLDYSLDCSSPFSYWHELMDSSQLM